MKFFVEQEVLDYKGNIKVFKKTFNMDFSINEKDFINADLNQTVLSLRRPCDVHDLKKFIESNKIVNYTHIDRCRIYSETLGGDYVFIINDPRTPCEFIVVDEGFDGEVRKKPWATKCFWHKKSNEGIEIEVNKNGGIL